MGEAYGYWSDGMVRGFRSIAHHLGTNWSDGTCEAVCNRNRWGRVNLHDPPGEDCACGIYASLSYADLLNQYGPPSRTLTAVIAAEGDTIIGTRGFRTRYARVVAYYASLNTLIREVAARQFKDARPFETTFELCEAYGIPLLPPGDGKREHGAGFWT